MELETNQFVPNEGDVVELPSDVGRIDTFNDTSPAQGERFIISVVGSGDMVEHVVLAADLEDPDVEDGSQILASYVGASELWYAIPLDAYGGDGE